MVGGAELGADALLWCQRRGCVTTKGAATGRGVGHDEWAAGANPVPPARRWAPSAPCAQHLGLTFGGGTPCCDGSSWLHLSRRWRSSRPRSHPPQRVLKKAKAALSLPHTYTPRLSPYCRGLLALRHPNPATQLPPPTCGKTRGATCRCRSPRRYQAARPGWPPPPVVSLHAPASAGVPPSVARWPPPGRHGCDYRPVVVAPRACRGVA